MSIEVLLERPTMEGWRDELRVVLDGERDADIAVLGSAEEYVERLIRDSKPRNDSEHMFQDALNFELIAWQPSRPSTPYYIKSMLELVGAYTPPAGFAKLVELVELWRAVPTDEDRVDLRLRMRALATMARYFMRPPVELNAAFESYTNLLRELSIDANYSAYCIARLLDLGEYDLSRHNAVYEITSNPLLMRGVIAYFKSRLMTAHFVPDIDHIFWACIRVGENALKSFIGALAELEIPLSLEENSVSLAPRDGHHVVISVPETLLEQYLQTRWSLNRIDTDWLARVTQE